MFHGITVEELAEIGGVSKQEVVFRLAAAGITALPSVFDIEMSRKLQMSPRLAAKTPYGLAENERRNETGKALTRLMYRRALKNEKLGIQHKLA